MQIVGKIQAVAPGAADHIDDVLKVIRGWTESKFHQDADGSAVIRRTRASAMIVQDELEAGGQRCSNTEVLEPVDGGELQTTVKVLAAPSGLHLNCTLSLGATGGLAPPNVDLFSPRFIREIVGLKIGWRSAPDSEHLLSTFANVGAADLDEFVRLLQSSQRRLPLILVSDLDGRPLASDLHSRLAADLAGLAHTCRIDQAASWALTQRLDREWSCYNGSVRLFWPFRGNRENPRNHPLWTWDRLTSRADDERSARDRIWPDPIG